MNDELHREADVLPFANAFLNSKTFDTLFKDGMRLVEETATYLDGPGRLESKKLGRDVAMMYALESIRLTTRLMTMATWLLLQRSVKEGGTSPAQFLRERRKLGKFAADLQGDAAIFEELPEGLSLLIERSLKVRNRIQQLDATLYPADTAEPKKTEISWD
jgi:regulator of CtrA degradation